MTQSIIELGLARNRQRTELNSFVDSHTGLDEDPHIPANCFPQYRQKELEAIYRWECSPRTDRDNERLEYDLRSVESECES